MNTTPSPYTITPCITFMLEAIHEAILAPQVAPQITPQVTRLLSVLEGEMWAWQILHPLGLSDRKSFRQRYLLPALEYDRVEMTRREPPTARNQKYRLTSRGRAVAR